MQLFLEMWCDLWHICICEIVHHPLNQDFVALQMLGDGFQIIILGLVCFLSFS